MPMFQPSKRGGVIGFEGGGDGQVLDLYTAVKDGVLGGVNGGIGGDGKIAVDENLDLKKMIAEMELADIPTVFICPISLEPMQDPVTLCTGQTYERSNILKWFSLGHLTCPTTMQELWDDSVTPNKTLYHLIYTWFSQKYLLMKKRFEDVHGRAIEILGTLRKAKGQARVRALSELRQVVVAHSTARKTVVDEGGISVISSLLGPFTSHAVGSEAVAILVNLDLDSDSKAGLLQPAKVSLMVDMLNDGSMETKINCAKLIGSLVEEKGFRAELVSSHSLLVGLLRLVKDKRHKNGISPALRLLKSISVYDQVRNLMVSVGAVPQLVDRLPTLDPECLELALFVLDALCLSLEGRVALKKSENTIPNTVRILMRVSENCTGYALSILWWVCKLAPEECSPLAIEAGLAAKLLLVIQSGCDPALKQRSSELLKLCSLNYSDTIFISKCKLTRTIQ
ncbi:PREDICTED: U-box domain-containing protein 30 [Tarenaya hassleriana]|uniref:U-box domain-containing protein 30 n=1 Tax=Tarenaya hassleriana TaxID=28532 RepID=UPI00053C4113|nr:PREDICTED: U-box domain-containing protein 30 [Tarenaya hassleriana]